MIILVIIIINNNIDAGEMGQPGSIPTVHMKVKGENRMYKVVLCPPQKCYGTHPSTPHTPHTKVKS